MGDAYFYPTPQDCIIDGSTDTTKRYIYVDNVTKGNLMNAKGLLPGIIQDLGNLNPLRYLDDLIPVQPKCINVSLEVIDNNNNATIESHYMALNDVRKMDPCDFPDRINPAIDDESRNKCQGFKNKKNKISQKGIIKYIYLIIFIIIIIFLFNRYN